MEAWFGKVAAKLASAGLYVGIVGLTMVLSMVVVSLANIDSFAKYLVLLNIVLIFGWSVIPAALKSDERRDALKQGPANDQKPTRPEKD